MLFRILITVGLLATFQCLAQAIDPKAVREEDLPKYWARKIAVLDYIPSPTKRAQQFTNEYELVALGEFASIPEPDDNYLTPRPVIATFLIDELYKGRAGVTSTSVELISDMLVFPGKNISRYEKRNQLRKEVVAQRETHLRDMAALDKAYGAGTISAEQYAKKRRELEQRQQQWSTKAGALSPRLVGIIDQKTFYDLNGAIKPGEKYLLALNPSPDRGDVYRLDDAFAMIFWSDTRDEIVTALREQARKRSNAGR